jgi:ABC-2 type transport system permease protein
MDATSRRRVATLVRKELRQIFRDPKTKRIIFASPIIQLLLFGYAVTTDVHHVTTFVVDHDHSVESRALVDAFTAGAYFKVVGRSDRPRT